MAYFLSKFLNTHSLRDRIEALTSSPLAPTLLTPGQSRDFKGVYKRVAPVYSKYKSGAIFKFDYTSKASRKYQIHDESPMIIYINKSRIVNFPNGPVIFGINMNYMDARVAIAFARVIRRGKFFLNYNQLTRVNEYIAGAMFRSYYISGIQDWKLVNFVDLAKDLTGGEG